MKNFLVLSVDDNEDDHFLIQRVWRKSGCLHQLQLASDGQKAIDFLSGVNGLNQPEADSLPSVILLDLKMPRKNGFEVLEWLRSQPLLKSIPVAILTSSENKADIERAYALGASWYFVKPVDSDALYQLILDVHTWLGNRDESLFKRSTHFKAVPDRHQLDVNRY